MKRWVMSGGGNSVESVRISESPLPLVKEGEVRIKMHSVSLNYRDQAFINALFGPSTVEYVPLSDGAGVVDEVGAKVTNFKVGDRVAGAYYPGWLSGPPKVGMGWGLGSPGDDGMLSEYVVLPQERVVALPRTVDFGAGSCLPCAGLTAWNATNGVRQVAPGEKVLIIGTGGVSLFAASFAKGMGGEVHALTRNPQHDEKLKAFGVRSIFHGDASGSWGDTVYQHTGGVDRVINTIGTGVLNECMRALRPGGEVATIGMFDNGGTPDIALLGGKAISIRGLTVGNVEMFREMSRFIDTHSTPIPIYKRFPVDQLKEALAAQASSGVFGKVVLNF